LRSSLSFLLPVTMATYAAYRHIELDKVGYSKKRVRNPSSEIFNVMCTPPSVKNSSGPRRSSHSDSFTRLFGTPENKVTPRRASLTKQGKERKKCESFLSSRIVLNRSILWKIFVKWFESIVTDVTNRNPVTGDGVASWDQKPLNRTSPRIHNERNPVTGEVYSIVSPASTPTKSVENGFAHVNGTSTPMANGNPEPVVNGNAATE
jgi:hypothetical protein